MEFTVSGTTVRFDERTMQFAFTRDGAEWNTCADFKPTLQCAQGTFAFADATSITHEQRETGTGTGIPWGFADGDIPVSACTKLREPRHVTASRFEAAVEGDIFGAHGGRPCVGDHHTLLMGDECRVMVVGAIEVHGCGPRHISDVQALLIERNPFEEHIA